MPDNKVAQKLIADLLIPPPHYRPGLVTYSTTREKYLCEWWKVAVQPEASFYSTYTGPIAPTDYDVLYIAEVYVDHEGKEYVVADEGESLYEAQIKAVEKAEAVYALLCI